MFKNDGKMLEKIIETRKIVKKKFNQLRSGEIEASNALERSYKPLTKSLSEFIKIKKEDDPVKQEPSLVEARGADTTPINESVFNTTIAEKIDNLSFIQFLENYTGLARKYLAGLIKDEKGVFDDSVVGVRYDDASQEFRLGNSELQFDSDDLLIKSRVFVGSPGLYELIFKKSPKGFTKDDLTLYKEILELTCAHRRGYHPDKQYAGSRTDKWRRIIKPMIMDEHESTEFHTPLSSTPSRPRTRSLAELPAVLRNRINRRIEGEGYFDSSMRVENKPYQYVFWDDPNELVDRLCLLLASRQAGNSSHNNEIVRIEEELREANIIW